MKRLHRSLLGTALATLLSALLAAPALAGGWAVVTLDQLPREVRAGQTLSLGFMVRQHGVTPIDSAFDQGTMRPILAATNTQTGAQYTATARKEGPIGHFVVDVTFPSEGVWTWAISPPPFEATKLGTLIVLAAAGEPQTGGPEAARIALRLGGTLLLLLAVVLWLRNRRPQPARAAQRPVGGD